MAETTALFIFYGFLMKEDFLSAVCLSALPYLLMEHYLRIFQILVGASSNARTTALPGKKATRREQANPLPVHGPSDSMYPFEEDILFFIQNKPTRRLSQ